MVLTCPICGITGDVLGFGLSIRFGFMARCDSCFEAGPPPAVLKPHKCRICKQLHPKIYYRRDYVCLPCQEKREKQKVARVLAEACRDLLPGWQKCRVCKEIKTVGEFNKAKAFRRGVQTICKGCHGAIYNPRSREKRAEYRAANPRSIVWKCMRCGLPRPLEQYAVHSSGRRIRYCADCSAEVMRIRRNRITFAFGGTTSNERRSALETALSDGSLTPEVVRRLFAEAKDCPYCGARMRSRDKTRDHMVPLSKGGPNSIANILICCKSCNSRKRDMDFDDWLKALGAEAQERLSKLYLRRFGAPPEQHGLLLVYDPSLRVM